MTRARIRDLGIAIGEHPTGPHNAITDVSGVLVGHTTVVYDEPSVARTGVTMVLPRDGRVAEDRAFAGFHRFNGNGEMTGLLWVEESGLLTSAIGITNTHQVGTVRDAMTKHAARHGLSGWYLPVVAETYDGRLNDIGAFHVTEEHVYQAIDSASDGSVAEGNVGGGTGMVCHEFKGGIGTSSREVDTSSGQYVVGALVQANYGARQHLRVNGVPVGKEIGYEVTPSVLQHTVGGGSIIIIVATDAPLLPFQCRRLAQRATVGLARVGGTGPQRQWRHISGVRNRQPRAQGRRRPGDVVYDAERPHGPDVRRDGGGSGGVRPERARRGGNDRWPQRPHGPRTAPRRAPTGDGQVRAAQTDGQMIAGLRIRDPTRGVPAPTRP